ncbi:MAG: carbohydrate ABC transporter permease [Spirochaetaceae bacterium]|jgi:ABC-type glycerol-3-phosphate transport system permease component|nr:carbohydrate ABC transporter permease [Spirochaetaceae bacterium]
MNTKRFSHARNIPAAVSLRLVMLVFMALFIVPVPFSLFTSFKSQPEFYRNIWGPPEQIVLGNYTDAFIVGRIGDYFLSSIIIAAFSLVLIQILSILMAYALARLHIPFAELILVILLVIQILPTESQIVPLYIMFAKIGLFKIPYWGIILAYTGWSLPGTVIIMKNFFETIPAELMESARIDGSGETRTLIQIMLPLMKSAMATCLVFNFKFVWGELMWAQIATAITDKGVPLTIGLLNFRDSYGTNWPMLTAAICMVMIPLFVVFLFTQKYFVAGLTAGSVKG